MVANLYLLGVMLCRPPRNGSAQHVGTMSWIARIVVFILFILSAWSLGVMIDRAMMYSAARKQSRIFVQQVAGRCARANSMRPSPSPSATRKATSPRLWPPGCPNSNRHRRRSPKARCGGG